MQQPYFLNEAGNKKMKDGIMLWYAGKNPFIQSISGTDVTVHSTYNGEPVTQNYPSLNNAAIALQADSNTEVYIEGNVTSMSNLSSEKRIVCHNTAMTSLNCSSCTGLTSLDLSANTAMTILDCFSCTGLTSLDLSANTALKSFFCSNCTGLTSLDLSANTALTSLFCSGCNYIETIKYVAQDTGVATKIAGLISGAFATDGNVYCKGTYSSTVQTAATSKGWTYHTLE